MARPQMRLVPKARELPPEWWLRSDVHPLVRDAVEGLHDGWCEHADGELRKPTDCAHCMLERYVELAARLQSVVAPAMVPRGFDPHF